MANVISNEPPTVCSIQWVKIDAAVTKIWHSARHSLGTCLIISFLSLFMTFEVYSMCNNAPSFADDITAYNMGHDTNTTTYL